MEDIADSANLPETNLPSMIEDQPPPSLPQAVAAPENTYDDLFPSLPASGGSQMSSASAPAAGGPHKMVPVGSSQVTQVFTVPSKERKQESEKFGERESLRTCQNIMKDTGAHIEISSSKDMTLTFLISGKQSEVLEARRKILVHFQQQTNKQIALPKECRGHILGRKGERLKELEKVTATKISMSTESESLTITGTREGIEKAENEILVIVAEASKKSVDRLKMPKIYYPFIAGPHNEKLNKMMEETGAKISLRPVSMEHTDIVMTGEKEAVQAAKSQIEAILLDMEKTCKIVSVEVPKAQHKYIHGARWSTIHEILAQTGVSVELPPADVMTDTITLRGPQECLGQALSLVYEKANSVRSVLIDAPAWIHKYIIGRKRAKDWGAEYVDVHIESHEDTIKIEGPPGMVEKANEELSKMVDEYKSNFSFWESEIDPRFSKHIIGKAGANINRLQDELGVSIFLETKGVNTIRIEGPVESLAKAEKEIREKIDKLENEKEKDVIIDHKLFPKLIGSKGDKIREIRDKFKNVQIIFPYSNDKTDIVKLRGRKDEVDACHKHMIKIVKDLQESSFRLEVPIFKKLHRYVIGKGGVNIKKIREETHTNIDLPAETEENDVIEITGKKADVYEARDQILKIQNDLGAITTAEFEIPTEYHKFLLGVGSKIVTSITDECGGVIIKFLDADAASKTSKVSVKGLTEDVEKAKQQLLKLSTDRQLNSFTTVVRAKPQYHKFLIGKNGATVKRIRESTETYIFFPAADAEDNESITVIGKEEGVNEAQRQIETILKDIDNIVEDRVDVDPKHHRHFMQRRRKILDKIIEECGGIMISFPREREDNSQVVLKGAKDCIAAAKQRILDIVSDLENQITIECEIPQKYHRHVMGSRGRNVQEVTSRYDVQIKFPARVGGPPGQENMMMNNNMMGENAESLNGDVNGGAISANPDLIKITGTPAKCEAAKEALVGMIQEMDVPYELHKNIIGQKAQSVREIMNQHDVFIALAPAIEQNDTIKIIGMPENVEEAKKAIAKRVEEIEQEKKERELKSFEIKMEVDPAYHYKIIGRKGVVINQIRNEFDVQITFPARGEEVDNIVTIQGYEEACHKTKEAIEKIVSDLENVVKEVMNVDPRVLPVLIGQRGRNLRKVTEDYKVEIKIPRSDDPNPNAIMIMGSEENVNECKQHILDLQEEFMEDALYLRKKQNMTLTQAFEDALAPVTKKSDSGEPQPGFVVKGAPWQSGKQRHNQKKSTNTSSIVDFPEFGLNANAVPAEPEPANLNTAWGQPR